MKRRGWRSLIWLVVAAAVGAACGSTAGHRRLEAGSQPGRIGGRANAALAEQSGAGVGEQAARPAGEATAGAATGSSGGQSTSASGGRGRAAGVAGTGTRGNGSQPGAGAKSEILLGSIGTSSGIIGESTAIIPAATRAWVSTVNERGGLNGHPVRVLYADTGADPGRAQALVTRMDQQDHVLAFISLYSVTETPVIASYLDAHSIPAIGAPGGDASEDTSTMIFDPQQGADAGVSWGALLAVTSQSDKRKFAILYCSEAASCSNQDKRIKEFAPKAGVQVVSELQISIAQPDYTAAVIAARNAGADVVCVLADSASIIRVAQSAHRQGWNPIVSGTYTINNQAMARANPADTEGMLGFSATAPYASSPLLADYRAAMERFSPGEELGGYGATAWVQDKLWERIAPALGDNPTRNGILAALYALRRETLGGLIPPVTFPQGPHGNVNLCGVPIKVSGGKITAPQGDKFVCAPGWAPA